MDKDKEIIDSLKQLKKLRDENKKKVEKIRNTDLEEKKKIINCTVNLEIILKLINEGIIFDPRGDGGKLVWINNGIELNLIDTIELLRTKLNSES